MFPSEKELKKIRQKLNKAEPSILLQRNASKADKLKYQLCEQFVVYLLKNNISQVELAKKLKVSPARISEIVKYKINLFTIDKLIEIAERLSLKFEIKVA